MPRSWANGVFALLLLSAACTRFATVGTDTIGPGYAQGGGSWGTGGGITVAARVFERNGVTVVCGAWTTDRQSVLTSELNENMIETGMVYVGQDRVAWNLGFMTRVGYSDDISGAQANCIASSVPWRAEFAAQTPRIHIPRLTFVLDASSGLRVTFLPGARASVIR